MPDVGEQQAGNYTPEVTVVTVRCQRCNERWPGEVAPAIGVVERSLAYGSHSSDVDCEEEFRETGTCPCGATPKWAYISIRRESTLAAMRAGRFHSREYAAALGIEPQWRHRQGRPRLYDHAPDPDDVPSREEALRAKRVVRMPLVKREGWVQLQPCRRCRRPGERANLVKLFVQAERAARAGTDLYR